MSLLLEIGAKRLSVKKGFYDEFTTTIMLRAAIYKEEFIG